MSIKADRSLGTVAAVLAACLLCAMPFAIAQQMTSSAAAAMERDAQVLMGGDVTVEGIVENLKPSRTRAMRQPLLITFETGSSTLTPQSRAVLDKVGQALKTDSLAKFDFTVEGHADPRGGDRLNQPLSLARADSVCVYLEQEHRIDPHRLGSVGKGSSELLNTDDVTAPENRRVTIVTNLK
jgi:outer membrane protein OmpA-like peptidoglycan-associated protein